MKETVELKKKYFLSPQAVDEISDDVADCCTRLGCDSKEVVRYRLSMEECALKWLKVMGEGVKIRLSYQRRLRRNHLILECKGERCDPFFGDSKPNLGEDDLEEQGNGLLNTLNLLPEFYYTDGVNRLVYTVKKKQVNPVVRLLLVLLAACAMGVLGMLLIPETVRMDMVESFIGPVYDAIFRMLGCIAGPMIFLSVTWGIYGIGDATTFGRVGKSLLLRYLGTVLLVTALEAFCFPLFGFRIVAGGGGSSHISSLFSMLLDMVPANLVDPFTTGNTLQIIFLAVLIGIAMLLLGRKTTAVAQIVEQINYVVQFLMELISKLVPFFVFIVLLNLIWSGNINQVKAFWKPLAVLVVGGFFVSLGFTLYTAIRQRKNPFWIIKKVLPAYLIALTTASSSATFSTMMDICRRSFGIRNGISGFGIPLGVVIHKPILAVYYLGALFYFSSVYGITVTWSWFLLAILVAAIVAVATPPIPGGAAAAYTILFSQMGIPTEALGVALALDIITDFFCTSYEMYCIPLSLYNAASGLGMTRETTESAEGKVRRTK